MPAGMIPFLPLMTVTLTRNAGAQAHRGRIRPPAAGDESFSFQPSSGAGFKPLADQIHALGLKFGFHMMRGIPRQAVLARTPIEGSTFTAADAANTNSICGWCPDMFGVRDNAAGPGVV